MRYLTRISHKFGLIPTLISGLLVGHPFFPAEGVDALLFVGPTYSSITIDPNLLSFSQTETLDINTAYAPGFTAGARILLDHDMWDGSLIYNWTHNTANRKQTSPSSIPYNIANDFPFPAYALEDPTSSIDLSFKSLFLEIGRFLFDEGKNGAMLRYHLGFAGTWENEEVRINTSSNTIPYTMHMLQDVWAAGFRTGFDGWYFFIPECALHATAATSLLWSRYRVRRKDAKNALQDINVESNYRKTSPGIDMSFGIHVEKEYKQRIVSFDVSTFLQVWTNHLRFFLLTNPQQQGDLSINGITATLSISL